MRYMWIISPRVVPNLVTKDLDLIGSAYVKRILHFQGRVCWALITSWTSYHECKLRGFADHAYCWSITSCNKQYVTDDITKEFLGCMAEVSRDEANATKDVGGRPFYIVDPDSGYSNGADKTIWMPVMRNPNKQVPTGIIKVEGTETGRFPAQDRPWPLKSFSYEDWKAGVMKDIGAILDKNHLT